LKGGDWEGLRTVRDLRVGAVDPGGDG